MKTLLTTAITLIAVSQTTWAQQLPEDNCLYQSTSLVCESSVNYRDGQIEILDKRVGPMQLQVLPDGSKACQAVVALRTVNGKFVATLQDTMRIFAHQLTPVGRKVIFNQIMKNGHVTQVLGNRNPNSPVNAVTYSCFLTR
jgi:hypothetical protein